MMAKRKRAPGGGRKRFGPSVARNLTIRIDDDLREQLEAVAGKRAKRKRNWNISQEILLRLRWSLNRDHEERHDPGSQALADVILAVAEMVQFVGHYPEWHLDPWVFRSFKVAVARVLDALEPGAGLRKAREPKKRFSRLAVNPDITPEEHGNQAAAFVLHTLLYGWTATEHRRAKTGLEGPEFEELLDAYDYEHRSTVRARRGLRIEEPKEEVS
jgi:hypothetical protein